MDTNTLSWFDCYLLGVKDHFRGEQLLVGLSKVGIDANIVWGFDSSKNDDLEAIELSVDRKVSKFLNRRSLSHGEIACALGHLRIYSEFAKSEKNWALVLEDDATVSEDLFLIMREVCDSLILPSVIQLHGNADNPSNADFLIPISKIDPNSNFPVTDWLIKSKVAENTTHGYLINKQAVLIINQLMNGRKITSTADWPYEWKHKVEFWKTLNDYVVQSQAPSLIELDRTSMREQAGHFPTKLLRLLRFLVDFVGVSSIKAKSLGLDPKRYYLEMFEQNLKIIYLRSEKFSIAARKKSP